ncbi:unnamed protein product [Victoria cruziana]
MNPVDRGKANPPQTRRRFALSLWAGRNPRFNRDRVRFSLNSFGNAIRTAPIEPKKFRKDSAASCHYFRVFSYVNFRRVGGFLGSSFLLRWTPEFFFCGNREVSVSWTRYP